MSDNFNGPSMQNMLSQVIKEIQNGLTKLEQTVTQATQPATGPTSAGEETYAPPAQSQATPAVPTTPYNGPRWEYKVVYVNFRGQISSEGQQIMIGRGERRSSFVRNYLDQIGDQGWELSGVSPLGESENSYFIFKRPATGDRKPSTSTATSGQRVEIEEVDETGASFVARA